MAGEALVMKKRVAALILGLFFILNALPCAALDINPATDRDFDVPCQAAILIDEDSGTVLYEKNADESRPIASITKIMTLLLTFEALEAGKVSLSDIVPVSEHAYHMGGSQIWLEPGEQLTLDEMLKAICISSANDAAVAVAEFIGGSEPVFVERMNARAKELGCTDTTFSCVHGLYDYGNVSTAEDLAKIAAACYADETYMQAANTLTYTLPATNLHQNERSIKSTNLMLDPEYAYYRDYIRGMKTGFTTLAGRCFVTFAQQDGHTYGLVVLGSDLNNIYRECSELLDWAFSSFADRPLVDTETVLTTLPLTKCRAEETVELYAANDLSGYGHADDEVTFDFSLPESAAATIKEGAVLGTATVYLDGYEMGTVDLVTHREYVSDFRTDAKTTLLLMAALVGILIVLGFLTMVAGGGSLNLRRRNRSRRR